MSWNACCWALIKTPCLPPWPICSRFSRDDELSGSRWLLLNFRSSLSMWLLKSSSGEHCLVSTHVGHKIKHMFIFAHQRSLLAWLFWRIPWPQNFQLGYFQIPNWPAKSFTKCVSLCIIVSFHLPSKVNNQVLQSLPFWVGLGFNAIFINGADVNCGSIYSFTLLCGQRMACKTSYETGLYCVFPCLWSG